MSEQLHFEAPREEVRDAVNEGDEFVLMVRRHQSDGFKVWASGNQDDAAEMALQGARQLDRS